MFITHINSIHLAVCSHPPPSDHRSTAARRTTAGVGLRGQRARGKHGKPHGARLEVVLTESLVSPPLSSSLLLSSSSLLSRALSSVPAALPTSPASGTTRAPRRFAFAQYLSRSHFRKYTSTPPGMRIS